MAILKDLLVTGAANIGEGVTSPVFTGDLTGNVVGNLTGTATNATKDSDGKAINSYVASGALSGTNILLKNPAGGTISTIGIGGISITGNATTATKLGTTNVGDSNTPIYLNAGAPTACTSLDLNTSGNAATATKLGTARNFLVNLASTASASFDGSAGVEPGVKGTLAITNGGTGATTAVTALSNLNGVSKIDTGVQPIAGGLIVGGTSASSTQKGRIMITGNVNPLIGLQAIDSSGKQLTPYYVQVASDVLYMGPTSTLAMSLDRSGNVKIPCTTASTSTTTGALIVSGGVGVAGNLYAAKVYNAVWNDYAELFPKGEETETGDIIALDETAEKEKYIKAVKGHKALIGVHSNEYGHLIGGEDCSIEENLQKYIPIGLAGRVWVKVHDEPKLGDYITASNIPGVGEATNDRSQAIGIVVSKKQNGKVKIKII